MELKMKNTEIHSLEELREHADYTELCAAYLDGRLEQWLEDCYYEQLAEAVRVLRRASEKQQKGVKEKATKKLVETEALDESSVNEATESMDAGLPQATIRELCVILGIDPAKVGALNETQQADYERRLAALREHTEAPEMLARALKTATNQAELAALLNEGCKEIVLCGNSFTVPIRVGGIHYIGVGNPKMEAPYTEEQYRRAGVTFENITLPQTSSEEDADAAKTAAAIHGFDDFFENHTVFATLVHEKLKRNKLLHRFSLDTDASDVACEYYSRRLKAETEMRRVVNAAYDKASAVFSPESSEGIANAAAEQYAEFIGERITPILDKLEDKESKKVESCRGLVQRAERALQDSFRKELRENASYYKMYNRSYFLGKPEVEDLMSDVEMSDNSLLNGLYKMLQRDEDYVISGLLETINEMEDDVNSRADSFYSAAHGLYQDYCAKIEKIAEEIGKDLSDDDLEHMGMLKKGKHAS